MVTKENDALVEVYEGTPWEAELVKGLLEANGIDSMLKDETLGSIVAQGIGGNIKVLVREEDYSLARKVVDERGKEE